MRTVKFICAHCGSEADKPSGHVNRSRANGMKLFCSKKCSGLGRRTGKTPDERKAEKRLYDIEYRLAWSETIKARKSEYYQRTRDPAKEAEKRKERMPKHVEYCRRPEYRAKKKSYDRNYRAEKFYGEFAECHLLVMDLRAECLSRMTDYEIRLEKGTISKTQKRKRDEQRAYRITPEIGPMGNLERGQRG